MRKVYLLVIVVMVLALVGCGGKKKSSSATSPTPPPFVDLTQTSATPFPPGFTPSATVPGQPGASESSSGQGGIPGEGTLPPTWTPFSFATITPLPTTGPVEQAASATAFASTEQAGGISGQGGQPGVSGATPSGGTSGQGGASENTQPGGTSGQANVIGGPTLPPTWTPFVIPSVTPPVSGPGGASATPIPGGVATLPANQTQVGPTLPPTWTPFSLPSVTPVLSPTKVLTSTPVPTGTLPSLPSQTPVPTGETPTPYSQTCYELKSMVVKDHISVGEQFVLAWQPVPDAPKYQVLLFFPDGSNIFKQVIPGFSVTISGDLFTAPGVYGWQVSPLNQAEQPICFSTSGEVIVR